MTAPSYRDPLELVVTLKYASPEEFEAGFAPCVGPECVFFKTKTVRPMGTLVRLELRLRDGFPALIVQGHVRWSVGPDLLPQGRVAGMGLQVSPVDDISARRLKSILATHGPGELAQAPGSWAWTVFKQRQPKAAAVLMGIRDEAAPPPVDALHRDLDDAFASILGGEDDATLPSLPLMPPMPDNAAGALVDALRSTGAGARSSPPLAPPREPTNPFGMAITDGEGKDSTASFQALSPGSLDAPPPQQEWRKSLVAPEVPKPPPRGPNWTPIKSDPMSRPAPPLVRAPVASPMEARTVSPVEARTVPPVVVPRPAAPVAPTPAPPVEAPQPVQARPAPAPAPAPEEPELLSDAEADLLEENALFDVPTFPVAAPEAPTPAPALTPPLEAAAPPLEDPVPPAADVSPPSVVAPPPVDVAPAPAEEPVPWAQDMGPLARLMAEEAPVEPVAAASEPVVVPAPAAEAGSLAQMIEEAASVEVPAAAPVELAPVVEESAPFPAPAAQSAMPLRVEEEPTPAPADVAALVDAVEDAPRALPEVSAAVPLAQDVPPAPSPPVSLADEPTPAAFDAAPLLRAAEALAAPDEPTPDAQDLAPLVKVVEQPVVVTEKHLLSRPFRPLPPGDADDTTITTTRLRAVVPLPVPQALQDAEALWSLHVERVAEVRVQVGFQFTMGFDPRAGAEAPLALEPVHWPAGSRTRRELAVVHMDEASFSRAAGGLTESPSANVTLNLGPPPLRRAVVEEPVPAAADPWTPAFKSTDLPPVESTPPPVAAAPDVEDVFASAPAPTPPAVEPEPPPPVTPTAAVDDGWASGFTDVVPPPPAPGAFSSSDDGPSMQLRPDVFPPPAAEEAPATAPAESPAPSPPPAASEEEAPPAQPPAPEVTPSTDAEDGWAASFASGPPAPVPPRAPEEASTVVGPPPQELAEDVVAPKPAPPEDSGAFLEEGSGTPPPEPDPESDATPAAFDSTAEITHVSAPPPPEEEVFASAAPAAPPPSTAATAAGVEKVSAPQGPAAMVQGVGIGLPGGRLRQVFAVGTALPAQWNKRMPGARNTGVLELEVHESPSERAADGHVLGKVSIKPAKKELGVEWALDFHVDGDAVLKVVVHPADAPDARTERLYALENTTARGRARVARSNPKDPEGGGGFMRRLMGR